jgi:carboxymethylenebutenolidase
MPGRRELRPPRPLGHRRARSTAQVVEDKGITADIKVYPDAGHSFANQLPGQQLLRITGFGYNEAATQDA